MILLDIVIVNWNAGVQLHHCCSSLSQFGKSSESHIIVVDNDSSDDSVGWIDDNSKITLIRSDSNLGFGTACNLGSAQGSAEYILFLNPDAAVQQDTLSHVLEFMANPINGNVGICGVQLLNETGHVAQSCARFPTSLRFAVHAIGLDRVFPTFGYFMSDWDHGRTRDVDHVIGAFFLVRRRVFEMLGGFDERFFVYLEDLDFSYRANRAGWRSVYLADAQAFHAGGGTSNQVKARRLFYSLRSRLLYAFKHFSRAGALLVLLSTLVLEPFSRIAYALLRRSWGSVKETWSGYAMLWRWLPRWVLKGETR